MADNYIYLLQEREFIRLNENTYKIGKTETTNLTRFNQYPNGSRLIFQTICNNCHNIEKKIIKIFKNKFIQKKEYGNEYFNGNYMEMIDIIYNIIKNEDYECIINNSKEFNNNKNVILPNTFEDILPNTFNDILPNNFNDILTSNNEEINSYYLCKNCNYNTVNYKDMKNHLNKIFYCKTILNDYSTYSLDKKIILSLLPHVSDNKLCIEINEIKNDYDNKYYINRHSLIKRLNISNKKCYYCNKIFDKSINLRKHILLKCFLSEIENNNNNNNNNNILIDDE